MSPTWCVVRYLSSFRPSMRTHRIMGSWCSCDQSDTPWVNEDFRIKRISLGHYIPKRPCFSLLQGLFLSIWKRFKKHTSDVFCICDSSSFHRDLWGFSRGHHPDSSSPTFSVTIPLWDAFSHRWSCWSSCSPHSTHPPWGFHNETTVRLFRSAPNLVGVWWWGWRGLGSTGGSLLQKVQSGSIHGEDNGESAEDIQTR